MVFAPQKNGLRQHQLRQEMMRKMKGELFSKMSNGSPGPIIAEGSWSFSLTSGHGIHVHKNVYRNSIYRNKS
jgi:hypothetical protein